MENKKTVEELIAEEPKDIPASDDLCKALGIKPEDALELTHSVGRRPINYPQQQSIPRSYPRPATIEEPERSDPVEICMRTFMEYIADQDAQWWALTEATRRKRLSFIRESLMDLYRDLMKEDPTW